MSSVLKELNHYRNVTLYEAVFDIQHKQLITLCDAYLDINRGNEVGNVLQEIKDYGKPIFTFLETAKRQGFADFECAIQDKELLINTINNYCQSLR